VDAYVVGHEPGSLDKDAAMVEKQFAAVG